MRIDISAGSAGKKTGPIEIDPGGAKRARVDAGVEAAVAALGRVVDVRGRRWVRFQAARGLL